MLSLCVHFLSSAQVLQAEYFWDTDPGEGNGIALSAQDGQLNETIEELFADGIALPDDAGLHRFNIRAKNALGQWGPVFSSVVSVESTDTTTTTTAIIPSVTQAEYFWDNDPGQGAGTQLVAEDGKLDETVENVFKDKVNVPSNGLHRFNIRVKNGEGQWGPTFSSVVSIETIDTTTQANVIAPKVVQAEYFWDNDPGQGSATQLVAEDGKLDEAVENIFKNEIAVPETGLHRFNIRVKNGEGQWGPAFSSVVSIETIDTTTQANVITPKVVQAEYFWDNDPGEGSATPLLALDGALDEAVEQVFINNANTPETGLHRFCIRVKGNNGKWGPVFASVLSVEGITLLTPTGVQASDVQSVNKISVTWFSVIQATHYQVYRATENDASQAVAITDWITELQFDDTKAVDGTTYYYFVKAATTDRGSNATDFSAGDAGSIKSTTLAAPWGVSATDGTYDDMVKITWNLSGGATHYQVYRSLDNQSGNAVPVSDWITASNYEDTTATGGQTFYYFVRAATNEGGANKSVFSGSNTGYGNSSNLQPVVANAFPDQTLCANSNGFGISLSNIFEDQETADADLIYEVTGNVKLNVQNLGDSIYVTPSNDWSGTEQLTLTATDEGGLSVSDQVQVAVLPNQSKTISQAICEGETYTFGGQAYSTQGTYVKTFQSVSGCDSVVTLNLWVHQAVSYSYDAEICAGNAYEFDGQQLTTAGSYSQTLQTIDGCDSVVTLNLSVRSAIQNTVDAEICQGGSYTFDGQVLTTAGSYTKTFQSVEGCDSVVTLKLAVLSAINNSIQEEICAGSSYAFGGQNLTQGGTYTHTFQSVQGCDSIVTLNLSVRSEINYPVFEEICASGSYFFGGQNLTEAGTYTNTLQTAEGCDSTVTLHLSVLATIEVSDTKFICPGSSFDFGGQTLTNEGKYEHTFQSVDGCDSVVTLDLMFWPTIYNTVDAEICAGGSYTFGNQMLTTSGSYEETFPSVDGCDSIVTLNLTVLPAVTTTLNEEICNGDFYVFGTEVLNTSGTYVKTFETNEGCDSVVTLNLTVGDKINTTASATICDGASYTFGTQTLTKEGSYIETFTSSKGCDSTVFLNLSMLPVLETTVLDTICADETYSFNNNTLDQSGVYTEVFVSEQGCDSTVTLELTVLEVGGDACNDGKITSTEGEANSNITLYPVPTNGELHIEANAEIESIKVFSMLGVLVKETSSANSVDLSELPTGQYLIELEIGNKLERRMVTKR